MIALALLFVAPYSAKAGDARSVRFQRISMEDGLSQSFVYAIVQDRRGYLWFGTQEGLNRFDGHDFVVFAHDPNDPDSISDETIRTLLVDRSGALWVGTDAGGLSRYDADRRTFTNYRHDVNDTTSISSDRVRVIYEDASGLLWIGTDGAGLDRFDPATGTFTHFPHDSTKPESLAGAHVWSIIERSDGSLWVATDQGLSRFNSGTGLFTNFRHDRNDATTISDDRLRVLYEDSDNALWIGTSTGGLNRYLADSQTFERFLHDPEDASSISANEINSIFEDDKGVLWIGTVNGLNAWNADARKFERYFNDPVDQYSLSHNNVQSIFQDRGGVIWLGTYDGLNKWNPIARAMSHYRHDATNERSLSVNTVTTFAEDPGGDLWVGTFGGGLNRLDRKSGQFDHVRHQPEDSGSLSSDRVMALHVDRFGTLWAGTRDAGLNRFDRESGRFTRFRHDPADPASLSADGVTYILEDSDSGLWVGTFGGGLNRLDRESGTFTHYRNDPGDPTTLSNDRVLVLFRDSDQQLWIGTYGGGLNRLDAETGTFTRIEAAPDRPDGLSGSEIYMIQEDSDRNLWIGVKGSGLNVWRYDDRRRGNPVFERLTEMDGLPNASVYSGLWDESGNLWMSSGRGLSMLDVETLQFKNYNIGHGLQGNEYNLAAGFRASDGQLFFGGMNGFNAFRPKQLVESRSPPLVDITRFLSLNDPIDLAEAPRSDGYVEVTYEQYSIGFEFAALDFSSPETNRFEYKLEGLDKEWVDAGTKRQVTYTNLPAGDYSFRVRATNSLGVWSERAASLDFRVYPAPWRTWWAYLAYALLLASIIALLTRGRRARRAMEARYTENLQMVEARLSEAQRIASIGNWHWDAITGEWWWSEQVYRLLQESPETLRPGYRSFMDHVHPEDRESVEHAMSLALGKQRPYSIDHRIITRDGHERIVHQQAEIYFGPDGSATRVAGTIHDITERKIAEIEIKHRADYQALLARISSTLIRAKPEDVDRHVRDILEVIGKEYSLDMIVIAWRIDDRRELTLYDRWVRADADVLPGYIDWRELPCISRHLQSAEMYIVGDVEEMASEADADKRYLRQIGVKSFLAIPLLVNEKLEGVAWYGTTDDVCHWSDETVEELTLIADNLEGAIARSRAIFEIRDLKNQLQEENYVLREEVKLAHGFDEIVGEHPSVRTCLQAVEKVAPSEVAVLLLGETGTGKELFARAIHKLSARSDKPMIVVNCPTLPATLIESELFGHVQGAFTGAHSTRRGRFELADGGTIFLDEIGELPLELQAKLLRVLQTGEFDRIGDTKTLRSDVRLIAATNRNLQDSIDRGEFRADLYYRISSFPVQLPALRERKSDIPLLAEHFVRLHAQRLDKKIDAISARMLEELTSYEWPGNVRELESVIERAVISTPSGSVLELPGPLRLIADANLSQTKSAPDISDDAGLSSVERAHIVQVLEETGWKVAGDGGAASALGIPPSTLHSKMKKLGIKRPET